MVPRVKTEAPQAKPGRAADEIDPRKTPDPDEIRERIRELQVELLRLHQGSGRSLLERLDWVLWRESPLRRLCQWKPAWLTRNRGSKGTKPDGGSAVVSKAS